MFFLDKPGLEYLWTHIIAKLGEKVDKTSVIEIENGGTGATSAADALNNLGIIYSETEPPVVNGGIWLQPLS